MYDLLKNRANNVRDKNKISKKPFLPKNVNIIEGTKDIQENKKDKTTKRHLQNKFSLKRESDILYDIRREGLKYEEGKYHSEESHKPIIKSDNNNRIPLSSRNLRLLQQNIGKLETGDNICSHYLCSNRNMKTVDFSRLWFLFELEMSVNGDINLRNECYYRKVYTKIFPDWPQSNCLQEKLPSKICKMQLTHIILPKPIDFLAILSKQKNPMDLSDMSVLIESVIEEKSVLEKVKPKKIPSSYLAARDRKKVFESVSINVRNILNERDSSSNSVEKGLLEKKNSNDKSFIKKNNKLSYFRS